MFTVESMVRCYHVYRRLWGASVGEELSCQRERGNLVNPFAVTVLENGDVVGHIPQKILPICSTFLWNRMITCWVITWYISLLLWGKLSVFTSTLGQRLGLQMQLHSFVNIPYRSRIQLGVSFRGPDKTPHRSSDEMTARLHLSNLALTREIFE